MTKRLYYDDPYVTEFEGEIVRRLETPDGPTVVLKETYFYPESGGQPHDLGTIGGIDVTRVIESRESGEAGEDVLHVVARFPDSDIVKCQVDSARRRDHLQQHNGQHILSAAFLKEAGAQTVSFHLGSSTSTIDLDRPVFQPELIYRVENETNRIVRRSLPVRTYFVESEEASQLELRKEPTVGGTLRIVEIEGFDRQACCGTHPRSTADVGPIFVRSVERFKGSVRVEFVCGDRAMRDYKTAIHRIRSLTQVLNSPEAELVETASRLVDEKKAITKSLRAFREQALQLQVADWFSNAELHRGFKLVVRVIPDVAPAELRSVAASETTQPARVALLGTVAEGKAHLVFGRSSDVQSLDMASILRQSVSEVEGRGGGSAQIAQGGGPRLDGLEEALETAKKIVLENSKM